MSTSLLYHGFCIRGDQYLRADSRDGRVTLATGQEPEAGIKPKFPDNGILPGRLAKGHGLEKQERAQIFCSERCH
jgi:hypothetical protein